MCIYVATCKLDSMAKYVTLSAKTCIVCTTYEFFLFCQHYLQCLRSGYLQFQLNQASSFEAIVLDSRVSKKIDLYSNHTENKLQALLHLQP